MTLNRFRFLTITQEIPKDKTGLNGKIFVHVDHDEAGKFQGIRFSEKSKDGGTLDQVFHAIGDVATDIIAGLGA